MLDALQHIPPPSARRLALRVKPAAERQLRWGHPWLYDRSIVHQSHEGQAGDLAVVFDRQRQFLAIGLYDPVSPLRVRLLQHHEPMPIDEAWFQGRLAAASALRTPLQDKRTTAYRLVHGENDGLPGLVIDRYHETFVLKLYTAAWVPHLSEVTAALMALQPVSRLVLRLSRHVARTGKLLFGLFDGQVLLGPEPLPPVLFHENGLTFEADVVLGQKTGFYLDQRENRERVEALAAGRKVLNVFAYSGGFSLYAARGGARHIVSLDQSQPALAAAARNFERNQDIPAVAAAEQELLVGDAFVALAELARSRRHFDLVVVDPPAFANSQDEIGRALIAYARLLRLSLALLHAGGTLVFSSCSSRIEAASFFGVVHETATAAGRPLRELERTAHPLDHPITFDEGAYLKCLFAIAD